jgi:hypothetical protein
MKSKFESKADFSFRKNRILGEPVEDCKENQK